MSDFTRNSPSDLPVIPQERPILFVNTHERMRINEIAIGWIWITDNNPRIQALLCLREATRDEYLKFVSDNKLSHMIHNIDDGKLLFYKCELLD